MATEQPLSFNEEFHKLWNTVVERHSRSSSENEAKQQRPEQQQLLVKMISSERLVDPAVALMRIMESIHKEAHRPMRPLYPLYTAIETFTLIFNAAPAIARREAWSECGDLISAVDLNTYKRLAGQVIKEKLQAKYEEIDNNSKNTHKI